MPEKMRIESQQQNLGGGFQYFLFSPLFGEDSHFDVYFSKGLKPPTRNQTNSLQLAPEKIPSDPKGKESSSNYRALITRITLLQKVSAKALKIGRATKGKDRVPTIHFLVRYLSLREI